MSTSFQTAFVAALRDPALPPPAGLAAWNGARPDRRFRVYRDNTAIGLAGALASRFPATERIVGTDFFAALAAAYVSRHPPRSPLLLAYGDDFGDFIAGFSPAADLPYLADVARLEAARGRAYHAEDAAPLRPAALAGVAAERIGALVFVPHPSLSVLPSPYPVVTIWAMNGGDRAPAPVDFRQSEDALVVRPDMQVEVRRLPPGGRAFLAALAGGRTLADAAEAGLDVCAGFDLAANLAGLLQAGAFTAFRAFPAEA
ncbi:HvfC/BufC N-terminal domain-containing protein [Ensifer soli]|uniref:HvfC/BufC N-terminal domain-containing protein n=1 Tax=Ciceribacter sp. sgz301302 TaxID=3342379 RepID=UPI0035B9B50D